jgi:hypothetical protein
MADEKEQTSVMIWQYFVKPVVEQSRFNSQANHCLLFVNKETFQNSRLKKKPFRKNVFISAFVASP